ncbi:hypothetical protein [Tunicatimonas pelagia]|uniref:hypothetical protein n=1 Tax=Tunicatimonas pelagia TaxID=931531 RepID=UPI002666806C|nr:hypothetical protein [Tunicatimonas pelagia]WKN41909.1 hypothetical protein P0M28_22980 [Tunicatimonas pelagia]
MIQSFLIIFSAVLLLSSCQPSASSETPPNLTEAQEIYAKAIEVHDEVMPRMDEIMQLRQAVEARIDSLNQVDSAAYADTVQYMQFVVRNLQYADQGMMQWMRNVKKVPGLEEVQSAYQDEMSLEVVDTTNIVQIQQSQKTAIEQVKQQMESSIEEARSLLNE